MFERLKSVTARMGTLGRGSTVGVAGYASFAGFEVLTTALVARVYGAAATGVLFATVALFMMVSYLGQLGANTGLIRMIAASKAQGRYADGERYVFVAMLPVLAVTGLVAALTIWQAGTISQWLVSSDDATVYLRPLAAALPFSAAFGLLMAATRGIGTIRPTSSLERFAWPAARLAIIASIAAAGVDASLLAWAWVLPLFGLLPAAVMRWYRLSRLARHAGVAASTATPLPVLARELWTFSSVRGFASASEAATQWIDIPLVAALASPEAAGIYAVVSRLAYGGTLVGRGVVLAVQPQVATAFAVGDNQRALWIYQSAAWWGLAASLPLYLMLAAYPAEVLSLFGTGFDEGATALTIVVGGMLFSSAAGPIGAVLLMDGRAVLNLLNGLVALGLNLGLNLLLIPSLGMVGAAIAWCTSIVAANLAPLAQLWVLRGFHPLGSGLLLVTGAAIASLGALGIATPRLAGLSPVAGLCVLLSFALAAYATLIWKSRRLMRPASGAVDHIPLPETQSTAPS